MLTVRPTLMQAFELIVTTSRDGGFPALDLVTRSCKYRTPDGRKCVAGLFLPDRCADLVYNGMLFAHLPTDQADLFIFPTEFNPETVSELQTLHDRRSGDNWDHAVFVRDLLTASVFDAPEFQNHPLVQEIAADECPKI